MPHVTLAHHIRANVAAALAEDGYDRDFTAQLIPAQTLSHATVITRESAVLCGTLWFEECFLTLDPNCRIDWKAQEGARVEANQTLCEIHGDARAMLTAERPALNFLQTLSAVATLTQHYVEAIKGTQAKIMDTRKTLPGLRMAQKYAVKTGGGHNQRIGLFDGVLIKDNHLAAIGGSVAEALRRARAHAPRLVKIEIEVDTLRQLDQALEHGADVILLDNMTDAQIAEAVKRAAGRAALEVSGGVTLERLPKLAKLGVDFVSMGALTHSARAMDLSLELDVVSAG